MTIWGLTVLDLGALAFFLLAWLGYAPYLAWRGRQQQMVGAAMIDHRRVWMHELLGRDMKVADTAIVGHIMSTAGFFASTTVIVIGALLGVLVNLTRGGPIISTAWLAIPPPSSLEIKVVLILVVAVYAFQSFTWAIRQANFAAVMMGAAPRADSMNAELRARLAASMGNIITGVATSYDSGMRAYYFALGALTWVVSPVLFFLATAGVVGLLLYRQTRSMTAIALREIALARSETARPA
jgi:uncharacterized membrane protein